MGLPIGLARVIYYAIYATCGSYFAYYLITVPGSVDVNNSGGLFKLFFFLAVLTTLYIAHADRAYVMDSLKLRVLALPTTILGLMIIIRSALHVL